jgi:hypothetical protein
VKLAALERAVAYLQAEIKGGRAIAARTIIAAARRFGIARATLTRARWRLGLRSKKRDRDGSGFNPDNACVTSLINDFGVLFNRVNGGASKSYG